MLANAPINTPAAQAVRLKVMAVSHTLASDIYKIIAANVITIHHSTHCLNSFFLSAADSLLLGVSTGAYAKITVRQTMYIFPQKDFETVLSQLEVLQYERLAL